MDKYIDKTMKLTYIKVTKHMYKFFYQEDGAYGEFYMTIFPDDKLAPVASGTAELIKKDPEYAKSLLDGMSEALV